MAGSHERRPASAHAAASQKIGKSIPVECAAVHQQAAVSVVSGKLVFRPQLMPGLTRRHRGVGLTDRCQPSHGRPGRV